MGLGLDSASWLRELSLESVGIPCPNAIRQAHEILTVGTWFAFKYVLRRKARELELTNLNYGALARLIRDGGFWVSAIAQL